MATPEYLLYHAPGTRSGRTKMVLDLLDVEYDLETIDFEADEHKGREYRAVHPLGLVPSLRVDGELIVESAAQIIILADRHWGKGLAPHPTSPSRARYVEMFLLSSALVEPLVAQLWRNIDDPEARRRVHIGLRMFAERLSGPFLLGERMCAADVFLHWGLKFFDDDLLGKLPRLRDYRAMMGEVINWQGY
ncbi:MAG: glutathione S-transferase family protein [Pseudomonadota bacterium]